MSIITSTSLKSEFSESVIPRFKNTSRPSSAFEILLFYHLPKQIMTFGTSVTSVTSVTQTGPMTSMTPVTSMTPMTSYVSYKADSSQNTSFFVLYKVAKLKSYYYGRIYISTDRNNSS